MATTSSRLASEQLKLRRFRCEHCNAFLVNLREIAAGTNPITIELELNCRNKTCKRVNLLIITLGTDDIKKQQDSSTQPT